MKISQIKKFGVVVCLLATAALSAGCPEKPGDDEGPVDWTTALKRELGCAKEQFFSNRYMRSVDDPFEIQGLIDRIKADAPIDKGIQRKLEDAARNADMFFDVGLRELDHIAKRYAVASVIPAYLIADGTQDPAAASNCKPDLMTAVAELEKLVKDGKVFSKSCRYKTVGFSIQKASDDSTKARDVTPRVENRVLELSNQIASCGLQLQMTGNAQWMDIFVLNKYVRDGNMSGVSVTDPAEIYAGLKPVYDAMFKLLRQPTLSTADLAAVTSYRSSEKLLLISLREALKRQADVAQTYLGK
ncbi:MAG TPA: hypothetical protein PLH57_09055 [Oligoflexia bacterium]|nr:hypothetical protein [Oligoflexia bacterium]